MTLLTASQKARIAEYKATGSPVSVRDWNKRKQLAHEIREEIAR